MDAGKPETVLNKYWTDLMPAELLLRDDNRLTSLKATG